MSVCCRRERLTSTMHGRKPDDPASTLMGRGTVRLQIKTAQNTMRSAMRSARTGRLCLLDAQLARSFGPSLWLPAKLDVLASCDAGDHAPLSSVPALLRGSPCSAMVKAWRRHAALQVPCSPGAIYRQLAATWQD